MAISRAQMQKELLPGLHGIFGDTYKSYPLLWPSFFEKATSERSFEQEQKIAGFGNVQIKTEGQGVAYDTAQEAFTATYTHVTWALGFAVTEEAMEDNLYASVAKRYTKALARAFVNSKEVTAANIYNNGFTSGLGGDGQYLFSTAHPLVSGGSNANRPVTGADLNETSLDAARITIAKWTDERGLRINAQARMLGVPPDLSWTAERLLKTVLRTQTADNDINPINSTNFFPEGYKENVYFTDPNAWFIRTDVPDGLKLFQRVALKFNQDGDFSTGNALYRGRERYSVGWSDPLGAYGSPGA